jgi:hypothetical protein
MENHADFEAAYWGDCCNTFDEEQKHYVYARYMGIAQVGYSFNTGSKRILDIGGGPVSMLLKSTNLAGGVVVDPLMGKYPSWVRQRYECRDIVAACWRGEDIPIDQAFGAAFRCDEAWIYNVLQHTDDPEKVIKNAFSAAPVLRLFEWIDIPPHEGHPHMLTADSLTRWLGQAGNIVALAEQGCYGRAFYGVFLRP